jgi:hypothetical protein
MKRSAGAPIEHSAPRCFRVDPRVAAPRCRKTATLGEACPCFRSREGLRGGHAADPLCTEGTLAVLDPAHAAPLQIAAPTAADVLAEGELRLGERRRRHDCARLSTSFDPRQACHVPPILGILAVKFPIGHGRRALRTGDNTESMCSPLRSCARTP